MSEVKKTQGRRAGHTIGEKGIAATREFWQSYYVSKLTIEYERALGRRPTVDEVIYFALHQAAGLYSLSSGQTAKEVLQ